MAAPKDVGQLRWNRRRRCWQRWSGRRWLAAAYSFDPDALSDPSGPDVRTVDHERRERLMRQVREDEVLSGAVVLDSTPGSITVMRRDSVSHLLHFVLTVLTGGVWLLVWLLMVLQRREHRRRLEIDKSGHVWAVEAHG